MSDGNPNRIRKFDANGAFPGWWIAGAPSCVAVDARNRIYTMSWIFPEVFVFDTNGTLLDQWGSEGTGDGQFQSGGDIAFGSDGSVHISDPVLARVQRFTTDGVFLSKWGEQGDGEGQFHYAFRFVVDSDNDRVQVFGVMPVDAEMPVRPAGRLTLYPAIPNPLRDQAVILFDLPKRAVVSLRLYDVRGRLVREAIAGDQLDPGTHRWQWDGRNDAGLHLSPGIHFVKLRVSGDVRTTKVVKLD